MNIPEGLLILGFGGHARSVADVAVALGVRRFRFVDAKARPGESFLDHPVVRDWQGDLQPGWAAFSASGDGETRRQHHEVFRTAGYPLASLVAPGVHLGIGSWIGEGCFVGCAAHIGPMVVIGAGCVINTSAVVEHECVIGDYTHVSVNATVAGRSRIGAFCMVGAGATVIDRISVCDGVTIGAGAVVQRTIAETGTYVGVPARRLGGGSK